MDKLGNLITLKKVGLIVGLISLSGYTLCIFGARSMWYTCLSLHSSWLLAFS